MSTSIMLLILGMGIATYIPRMLPFIIFKDSRLSPFLEGILQNIPFAALGALIFPGVLYIQPDIWYGLVGAITAIVFSLLGANVIVVVIGSIGVLALISVII